MIIKRWRLVAVGVLFLALLSSLTIRLWYVQVAAAEVNEERALANRLREVQTEAPRGRILDANGVVLAESRASRTLLVDRRVLTLSEEEALVQNLSVLLDEPQEMLRARFQAAASGGRFVVAIDVAGDVASEVLEYSEEFPGVEVRLSPVRSYIEAESVSHVLGYLGKPSFEDLESLSYLQPNDDFGRAGIEQRYDLLLRGQPGREIYQEDSAGRLAQLIAEEPPVGGWDAVLTIDAELQHVVEDALLRAIRNASGPEADPSGKAAGIVMDATDGSVLAMVSLPTFDPTDFVGGIDVETFRSLSDEGALFNHAISGLYPPASTFKVVPYVVAAENLIWPEGVYSPDTIIDLPPRLTFGSELGAGSQQVFNDWTDDHGETNLHSAIEKSADAYFWLLALEIWRNRSVVDPNIVQNMAEDLGFGADTGIDLPAEAGGIVPDEQWITRNRQYVGGDLMNISIGQGDLVATPLQVTNSFAALVNGGKVFRPRVVDRFVDQNGAVKFENNPDVVRELEVSQSTLSMLTRDLKLVTSGERGTARTVFQDSPIRDIVGGKSGTAEIPPVSDPATTAWFVGIAPIDDPKYVVTVMVDRGGSGSGTAAPAVRTILETLMGAG